MELGFGEFEFEYQKSKIVDRNPPPGLIGDIEADILLDADVFHPPTVRDVPHILIRPYSAWDNSVDMMLQSYRAFLKGRRMLADAAYFCLTVAERDAGRRPAAAQKSYEKVFHKLGDLTANKGGKEARKAGAVTTTQTGSEASWQRRNEDADSPGVSVGAQSERELAEDHDGGPTGAVIVVAR